MKLNPLSRAQVIDKLWKLMPCMTVSCELFGGRRIWLEGKVSVCFSVEELASLPDSKFVQLVEDRLIRAVAGMMTKHCNHLPGGCIGKDHLDREVGAGDRVADCEKGVGVEGAGVDQGEAG